MGNFLSFLRRIIFIILVILSITMWTKGGVLLPLAIAIAAYILLLLITGIYTKLLFHKYPNKRGAFSEYLWTTDVCNFFIVHGIGNYGERLWNLWHFRNYKDDDVSFGEKVKRILVRIVIYTIIVLIVLQLLYVLVTMMVK